MVERSFTNLVVVGSSAVALISIYSLLGQQHNITLNSFFLHVLNRYTKNVGRWTRDAFRWHPRLRTSKVELGIRDPKRFKRDSGPRTQDPGPQNILMGPDTFNFLWF